MTTKTLWIDGQTKSGTGSVPAKLELRKDGDKWRWYCQDYDESGNPAGDCTQDTEISAATKVQAIADAKIVWAAPTWRLRSRK